MTTPVREKRRISMPVDTLFPTMTDLAAVTPIASRQVVSVPAMARMIRQR